MTRTGREPTTYHVRGGHAYHLVKHTGFSSLNVCVCIYIYHFLYYKEPPAKKGKTQEPAKKQQTPAKTKTEAPAKTKTETQTPKSKTETPAKADKKKTGTCPFMQ